MNKKEIQSVLAALKADSKERKFTQSVDLIVTLQDLNLKKPEDQLDFFMTLPYLIGKKRKVCAFVGPELKDDAAKTCDTTVTNTEFDDFKKAPRRVKTLAKSHDFFIAQANIMGKVAQVFGRALGPRGKMPNPKSGGVVPPKGSLKPLYDRYQKTLHIVAKKSPVVQAMVGIQDMDEEQIIDNVLSTIDQIVHHLPRERHNVKNVYLKFTMSAPMKVKK